MTQREPDYLVCLELKYVELENLFRSDELTWVKHIETVRKDPEDVKRKL